MGRGIAASPRARLFNLSDQMELAMGRAHGSSLPLGCDRDELRERLCVHPLPDELYASSGPLQKLNRKLKLLQQQTEAAGYVCDDRSKGSTAMVGCCVADRDPGPSTMRESAVVSGQASSNGPQVWGSTSSSSSACEGA